MRSAWARFKAWLFPCGCWCCDPGSMDIEPGAIPRPEEDGTATLWAKPNAKGEATCLYTHGRWLLDEACPGCGATA